MNNRNNRRREPRRDKRERPPREEAVVEWIPKTELGKAVMQGKITRIEEILEKGQKILEPELVKKIIPTLETDLLLIGQSKGKFGGGARRIFRQTQKKTPEGNKPSFGCFAIAGNKNGIIGGGSGKSKDTVPSREKATKSAILNIFKIKRGCGSWQCSCAQPHSIPFKVRGKCGSVEIELIPAPKGKGLIIEKECAKILKLAGIKDVWSRTSGQTESKVNLINACLDALKQLSKIKIPQDAKKKLGLAEEDQ